MHTYIYTNVCSAKPVGNYWADYIAQNMCIQTDIYAYIHTYTQMYAVQNLWETIGQTSMPPGSCPPKPEWALKTTSYVPAHGQFSLRKWRVFMCVCVCVHVCVFMCVCVCVCVCFVFVYIIICIYIYIYIYIYVHTLTHSHTHTHTCSRSEGSPSEEGSSTCPRIRRECSSLWREFSSCWR
jgi:hypothetical protein